MRLPTVIEDQSVRLVPTATLLTQRSARSQTTNLFNIDADVSTDVMELHMLAIPSTLPQSLLAIETRPLFTMLLQVQPYQIIGGPEGAFRRVGVVPGGIFQGSRLSGTVLPGGNDWQTVRSDGSTLLEVRLVLNTTDGATIGMTYKGLRRGSAEVLDRVNRGEDVDPSEYYFRTNPVFETAAPALSWLNGILAVGTGYRTPDGVVYNLFEVI